MYLSVSVNVICVWVPVEARKKVLCPLELELQDAESFLMWVLNSSPVEEQKLLNEQKRHSKCLIHYSCSGNGLLKILCFLRGPHNVSLPVLELIV